MTDFVAEQPSENVVAEFAVAVAVKDMAGDGDAPPSGGVGIDASTVAEVEVDVVKSARLQYSDQGRLDLRVVDGRQTPEPTRHLNGDALARCTESKDSCGYPTEQERPSPATGTPGQEDKQKPARDHCRQCGQRTPGAKASSDIDDIQELQSIRSSAHAMGARIDDDLYENAEAEIASRSRNAEEPDDHEPVRDYSPRMSPAAEARAIDALFARLGDAACSDLGPAND